MAPTPQQNDQTTLTMPPKIAQDLRIATPTPQRNDQTILAKPPKITQDLKIVAPNPQPNDQNTLAKPAKIAQDRMISVRDPQKNDQNTFIKLPKITQSHTFMSYALEKNNQNTLGMSPKIIQELKVRAPAPQHDDQNTLPGPQNTAREHTAGARAPQQNDQNTLARPAQNDQNALAGPPADNGRVVVAMVPFPAQGHLNQLLHLSRLLLRYHGLPVHYLSSATHNRQAALRVHGWDDPSAAVHFHDLPLPPFPTPNPTSSSAAATKFPSHLQPLFDSLHHLRRPLAAALRRLAASSRRLVVIHDSMMTSLVHQATATSPPNVETYNFHSVSSFAIHHYLSDLAGEKPDIDGVPGLDGCFSGEFAEYIARQYALPVAHAGSVFNTCRAVEGEYVAAVEAAAGRRSWALGPLNPVAVAAAERHVTLEWLDGKEVDSVIYVSFGTTTTMEDRQLEELAIGLERSQQNFIWVLRAADKGDVFLGAPKDDDDYNPTLPGGYEERVKGRGLIVRDWAPQLEILAHPSTGGFMSHCGWNSAMEALTMGVPVAAWPMHSDQPRNTCLLARVLRVAVPVVDDWSRRREIVPAAAVEGVVRRVMAAGGEARRRAAELGREVRRAAEKGGASRLELEAFVEHVTR